MLVSNAGIPQCLATKVSHCSFTQPMASEGQTPEVPSSSLPQSPSVPLHWMHLSATPMYQEFFMIINEMYHCGPDFMKFLFLRLGKKHPRFPKCVVKNT